MNIAQESLINITREKGTNFDTKVLQMSQYYGFYYKYSEQNIYFVSG